MKTCERRWYLQINNLLKICFCVVQEREIWSENLGQDKSDVRAEIIQHYRR